jgi:uncharacterized membrane protein
MNESNSIAEIERMSALSNGIYGVAMTLLVFSIRLPESFAADEDTTGRFFTSATE